MSESKSSQTFTVRLLLTSLPSISCTAWYGMNKDLFCSALMHEDFQICILTKAILQRLHYIRLCVSDHGKVFKKLFGCPPLKLI